MNSKDCTILVCSCDSYSDCWEPFFKLLKKSWANCPFEILLNTESKAYSYDGLNIRCLQRFSGKQVPYGERMIAHVGEIHTPYTLVMMDDFFLRKTVDEKMIHQVIEWLKHDPRAVVFNFQPLEDQMNTLSEKYPGYMKRPIFGEYKYNFQAAVWKTDYLLHSWKKHETPWEWETVANFRSFTDQYDFYVLQENHDTPIDYGYCNSGMGVYRGKWVKDSVVDLFKENGIEIDYSQRGFYKKSGKNVTRMKKKSTWNDEIRTIRSLGVVSYTGIMLWRVLRQLKKMAGMAVSKDYINYKRKQEMIQRKRSI